MTPCSRVLEVARSPRPLDNTACYLHTELAFDKGVNLARRTVLVSDQSGEEIQEGKGAKVTIKFNDARKGVRELDLTDAEAERLGGRAAKRRGRRPKSLEPVL